MAVENMNLKVSCMLTYANKCIPLTYIINTSILTGKFPTNWKISKIIPLYKKGDKKVLKNYRPVSLLSVAGMVLEKVVAVQIEDFFEENKLFGSFQFGFRKNKSTVSEMLTVFDTLLEAKEMKKDILLLMYDLSSAFDCVSHEVLLGKLKIQLTSDLVTLLVNPKSVTKSKVVTKFIVCI